MGKAQTQYNDAYKAYKRALDDYKQTATDQYAGAYNEAKAYTGEEGYQRALDTAKQQAGQLAGSAAGAAQSQATAAARQQGMTRAQAAQLGATQSAGAYGNTYNTQLANQQSAAYQAGSDRANAAFRRAGGVAETYGNVVTGQGNRLSTAQAENQNEWNRTWGAVGAAGSLLTGIGSVVSDKRLKDYVPTDEMVTYLQRHGLSRGKDDYQFDARQLATGVLVEMEHSPDFNIALEIAKDHLVENPEYYSKPMFKQEAIKSILDFKIDLSKYKEEK